MIKGQLTLSRTHSNTHFSPSMGVIHHPNEPV